MLEEPNAPQTESQQTAFRDAMESNCSFSMSWEDQVWEEEQQKEGSVPGSRSRTESSPEPDVPPPAVEGGSASNVSMIDNGLTQHDLDVVVEEEREEHMETGAPASPTAPVLSEESPMQQGSEARDTVWDDHLSQMSEESTDQNLSHDSNLNEDELLGMITDISVPGGHLDDSIALIIPWGRMICKHTCRTG